MHAESPMRLQHGSLYSERDGNIWYFFSHMLGSYHRHYYTVGYGLQGARIRGEHARRAKWFRRLVLRDLGIRPGRPKNETVA
jgi:hypothetical protein